jgi:RNA polymerase sigma-70 factor (ECF subfamily)
MTGKLLPMRRLPSYDDVSDEELVLASGAGDTTSLRELFLRHGARVARVLRRVRGVDDSDVEDLVQTTFIEVHRSADRFDRRSSAWSWIVGIALNVSRHHVRGEVRRRQLKTAASLMPEDAPSLSPYQQAAESQRVARLLAAIDALPEPMRVVITLADIEGMKGAEVAHALGVSEGAIWRRLHDARKQLQARMTEGGSP